MPVPTDADGRMPRTPVSMRKMFLTAGLLCVCAAVSAQEILTDAQKAAAEAAMALSNAPENKETIAERPKFWNNSLSTKIDFGHTGLFNWAAGGHNSYSLKAYIDGNANYAKESVSWTNRLQLDYGFLYSADKPVLQKSDDRIYLESKFGYRAVDKLFISAEYSFKSQFTNTYEYPTPSSRADGSALPEGEEYNTADWNKARKLKSGLFSPANMTLGLGLDYNPFKWLTVNLAPLTGGIVFVDDPRLRSSYSMPLVDENSSAIDTSTEEGMVANGLRYRPARFEFGAQLKVDVKVNVNDNFKYTSQILLFSNYLKNPQNIRVNWDNRIEWKLARFFSLLFTTNLIYDDTVMISKVEKDGTTTNHQRVQFKESLSFGFTYTIATKK